MNLVRGTILGSLLAGVLFALAAVQQPAGHASAEKRKDPLPEGSPTATRAIPEPVTVEPLPPPDVTMVVSWLDVISREFSLLNGALASRISDFVSREFTVFNGGGPIFGDAVSREVTINNTSPSFLFDAITREFTLFNGGVEPLVDAVSRELTINNAPRKPFADTVTREFTIFNGGPIPFVDAISREMTIRNEPLPKYTDAIAREFTVFNGGPIPFADAISREITIRNEPLPKYTDAIAREFTIFNMKRPDFPDAVSREFTVYNVARLCESDPNDCNGNGEPDLCDILDGRSEDRNGNDIPDECEMLPNLVAQNIVVPDEIVPGETLPFAWETKNTGNATAPPPWVETVYLSPDDRIGGDYPLCPPKPFTDSLNIGESIQRTDACTIPTNIPLAPGRYFVIVCTDADHQVTEFDETNNCAIVPGCWDCKQPDLRVTEVDAVAIASDCNPMTVQWTVANNGDDFAPGIWQDKVYLSADAAVGNDTELSPAPTPNGPLAAGESYTRLVEVTLPAGSHGDHFLVICTDTGNSVNEHGGEGNNCLVAAAPTLILQCELPDLEVMAINALDGDYRGKSFSVGWQVKNNGAGTARGLWTDRVYLSADEGFDLSTDELKATVSVNTALPPTSGYGRGTSFLLPDVASETPFWVFVVVDSENTIPEENEGNNAAVHPITVKVPEYVVTDVNADIDLALTPTATAPLTVNITGQVETGDGQRVADADVDIRITVKGTRRVIRRQTDASGSFSLAFLPVAGEAGNFKVYAGHPAEPDAAVPSDSFTLVGVRGPSLLTRTLTVGDSLEGSFTLQNLGNNSVADVLVEVEDLSACVDVQIPPERYSLPASGSVQVPFTVVASCVPGNPGQPEKVNFNVSVPIHGADEQATTIPMDVYVSPESPNLVVAIPKELTDPQGRLATNMPRGQQTVVSFTVTNNGGAPATNLQVLVPCAWNPDCTVGANCATDPVTCPTGLWLNLLTPASLGDLPPNESRTVELGLQPSSDLPLGPYSGEIFVRSSEQQRNVGFIFRAISTEIGDLLVQVQDERTFWSDCCVPPNQTCDECFPLDGTGPRLSGATVKVLDTIDGTLKCEGQTDASGELRCPNLLEDLYRVRVQAPGHGIQEQTVGVVGDQETAVAVFLPSQQVTYNWTVVPTDIEDEYEIIIEAVFETFVPVPVVTVEPASVDLIPGETKEVTFTVTNHGLVAADDVEVLLPGDGDHVFDAFDVHSIVDSSGSFFYGRLGPNEHFEVPVTFAPVGSTAGGATAATINCGKAVHAGVRSSLVCGQTKWYWAPIYVSSRAGCAPANHGPGGGGGGGCCAGSFNGGGGGGGSPGSPYYSPPNTQQPPCVPAPRQKDEGPPPCGQSAAEHTQKCAGTAGDGEDGPTCASSMSTGEETDPINLFSGEFSIDFEDLRIPGRGFDFVWSRRYRSKIGPNTPQGKGWDCSYGIRLARDGTNVVIFDGHGRQDVYEPLPDGNSWGQEGFFQDIRRDPDGSYTQSFPDKSAWKFYPVDPGGLDPLSGRLEAISDRNGNSMSFHYDAAGQLATITDTLGRPITIAYDADGYIESVTDFASRQVKYAYYNDGDVGGSKGDLKSVTTPAVVDTPNGNDFPEGKTTIYTYSTGFANERLNHNLLTITDAKGQTYLRNFYDPTDDPNERNFDRVIRQVWGDQASGPDPGDVIDIVYVPTVPTTNNGQSVMTTIVNDRVGNVTEYDWDILNRLIKKREFTGRANPDQPTTLTTNRPTNKLRPDEPWFFETRYGYNTDSMLTVVTHPNGNVTRYIYEADLDPNAPPRTRGNLRELQRLPGSHTPVGDQAQITEKFEYDTNHGSCCGFNFATKETDARGNVMEHEYDDEGNRVRTVHCQAGTGAQPGTCIPISEEDFAYNGFGQMTAHTLPNNGSGHRRRDEYVYYDSDSQKGYLHQQIIDAGAFNLTTTYEYDSVGTAVRVTDPRGHDTQYVVNALNQVVREESREIAILDNQGNPTGAVRYQRDTFYDEDNNVVRTDVQNVDDRGVVQANSRFTTEYEYEILNNLVRMTQEVEEGENFITEYEYEYDANRNRTLERFGEAVAGRRPDNVVVTLFDERDLVFREIRGAGGPDESITQYDYNGNRNQTAMRDGLVKDQTDHITTNVYDAYDRLVRTLDAMGNLSRQTYDSAGNRLSVIVEGELEDIPGGAGNVRLSETHYTYDALNRLERTEVAFFDATTQAPILDGLATTITEYSPNSQVVRTVDDNGHATVTEYDTANRRRMGTDAKGNTVMYDYDDNSNVVTVTEVERSDLNTPDETFGTTYVYDALDRLIAVTDNIGNTNRSLYDSRNNRTRTVDALNHEIRYVYDGLNRLLATIRDMNGDGDDPNAVPDDSGPDIVTTQSWDDSSRLVALADDNGNTTAYSYDALNRKIATTYADGTVHQTEYDVHDNAVKTTDANGNVVESAFDALDRLVRKNITPGPGVSDDTTFDIFKYDGLSRLIHAENDGSLVKREYDSLSHVLKERQTLAGYPEAVVTSVYDGVGNLLVLGYPSGRVVETSYDELNRKKQIRDRGDPGFIAEYFFRGPSRVERRDYGNNTRMDVKYDGVRRITRTRHTVVGATCAVDADCPTGNTCETETGTCIIDDRTYQWDAMYNKTQRQDVRPGGPRLTHDYAYDPIYRLVRSVKSDPGGVLDTIEYELDGVGNRIRVTGGSDPGIYVMDPAAPPDRQTNQYTATPFDARTYDANGNLIAIQSDDDFGAIREGADIDLADFAHFQVCFSGNEAGTRGACGRFDRDGDGRIDLPDWALLRLPFNGPLPVPDIKAVVAYDYANRMAEYDALPDAQRHSYAYDALGRRAAKVVDVTGSSIATRFLLNNWHEIDEQDGTSGAAASYVFGNKIDEALTTRRGDDTAFYHSDDLQSVLGLSDATAAVSERQEYEDYGAPTRKEIAGDGLLFTGRRYDPESRTYYYRTRYLDAASGNFVTRDTIGMWEDMWNNGNAYTYVGNNPSSRTDPFGLKAEVCCRFIPGVPVARHCYLRVDGNTYGLHPNANLTIGVPKKNLTQGPEADVGGTCKPCTARVGCNAAKCIEEAHGAYPIGGYAPMGANSNTYAATLSRKCCSEGFPSGLGWTPGANEKPPVPWLAHTFLELPHDLGHFRPHGH